MDLPTNEVAEAFARRILPGVELFTELAMFDALPREKREVVSTRLKVIDDYLETPSRGTAEAEIAAGTLGLSLRSFYRLVERLAERGPLAALAPNFGRRQRSDAVTELPPEIEAILKRNPTARWSDVERRVREAVAEHGVKVSASAVRRRLMSLRADAIVPNESVVFGRSLLLDRIAVDIVYAVNEEPRYVVADLLIDEETGYIVGVSMVDDDGAESIRRVLRDAWPRIGLMSGYVVKFARSPDMIRWTVPDDLVELSNAVSHTAQGMSPPIETRATVRGRFRFGTDLVRIIGDTLYHTRLLVRATPNPTVKSHSGGVLDRRQARSLLLGAVLNHNSPRFRELARAPYEGLSRIERSAEAHLLFEAIANVFSVLSPSRVFDAGHPDQKDVPGQ